MQCISSVMKNKNKGFLAWVCRLYGPVAPPKWQQSEAVIGGVHVIFKDGAGLSETACCEDVVQSPMIFLRCFADPLEAFLSRSEQFGYQTVIL